MFQEIRLERPCGILTILYIPLTVARTAQGKTLHPSRRFIIKATTKKAVSFSELYTALHAQAELMYRQALPREWPALMGSLR
jgi:hypothetical protein